VLSAMHIPGLNSIVQTSSAMPVVIQKPTETNDPSDPSSLVLSNRVLRPPPSTRLPHVDSDTPFPSSTMSVPSRHSAFTMSSKDMNASNERKRPSAIPQRDWRKKQRLGGPGSSTARASGTNLQFTQVQNAIIDELSKSRPFLPSKRSTSRKQIPKEEMPDAMEGPPIFFPFMDPFMDPFASAFPLPSTALNLNIAAPHFPIPTPAARVPSSKQPPRKLPKHTPKRPASTPVLVRPTVSSTPLGPPNSLLNDIDHPVSAQQWLQEGMPSSPFDLPASFPKITLADAWASFKLKYKEGETPDKSYVVVVRTHLLATLWKYKSTPIRYFEAPPTKSIGWLLFKHILDELGIWVVQRISDGKTHNCVIRLDCCSDNDNYTIRARHSIKLLEGVLREMMTNGLMRSEAEIEARNVLRAQWYMIEGDGMASRSTRTKITNNGQCTVAFHGKDTPAVIRADTGVEFQVTMRNIPERLDNNTQGTVATQSKGSLATAVTDETTKNQVTPNAVPPKQPGSVDDEWKDATIRLTKVDETTESATDELVSTFLDMKGDVPQLIRSPNAVKPMGTIVSRGMNIWGPPAGDDTKTIQRSTEETGRCDPVPKDLDNPSDSDDSLKILSPESYHKEIIKKFKRRSLPPVLKQPEHSPFATDAKLILLTQDFPQPTQPCQPTQPLAPMTAAARLADLKRNIVDAKARLKSAKTEQSPTKLSAIQSPTIQSPTIPSTAIPSPRPKAIDFFDATACHPLPMQRKSTPELVIPTEGDYWGKLNYQKRSEKIDFEVLDEFFCCEM
jgi:hypothetical protein